MPGVQHADGQDGVDEPELLRRRRGWGSPGAHGVPELEGVDWGGGGLGRGLAGQGGRDSGGRSDPAAQVQGADRAEGVRKG